MPNVSKSEFEILLICGRLPVPNDDKTVATAKIAASHFLFSRFFM
jgi:hypothetical protein